MTATTWTINAIKASVRAAGSHWFDPDTMRFFGTKVLPTVYQGPGGIFFVTSEKPPHGPRAYSVRRFTPPDDISTEGELAEMGKHKAISLAKRLAGEGAQEATEVFCPVSVLEQLLDDLRKHGNPDTHFAVAKTLIEQVARHHKLMEACCNGREVYDQDGEPLRPLANLRAMIQANAKAAGCKGVLFSGDPRGCTVKLVFEDGFTNDFAREGYCVPTTEKE